MNLESKDSLFTSCGLEMTSTTSSVKHCPRCKQFKPFSEFHKKEKAIDRFQPYCKVCNNIVTAEWHKENPDARLLREYNITAADKEAMVRDQNGCCAICEEPFKTTTDQHIDHCHESTIVRGILCPGCNMGLGQFGDSPRKLQRAKNYIEYHAKKIAAASVPTGNYQQSPGSPQLGFILTPRIGQDGNDPDHHSGTIQGQDVDYCTEEGSGDSVGYGVQEVGALSPVTRIEDHGQPDAEIIRLEFGRRDLFDKP